MPSLFDRLDKLERTAADHERRMVALELDLQPTPPTDPPTPPATEPARAIPGGVPSWAGEVVWDNRPPIYSKTGRPLFFAVPWMDAVHDTLATAPALVECDWLRLWARTADGVDRLLIEEPYATGPVGGGLFPRYPWFGGAQSPGGLPSRVEAGVLFVEPHREPQRVYHWWTRSRVRIPTDAAALWSEARVRVGGSGAVEVGFDVTLDVASGPAYVGGKLDNWTEGARSRWAFALPAPRENDWQLITAGKP